MFEINYYIVFWNLGGIINIFYKKNDKNSIDFIFYL